MPIPIDENLPAEMLSRWIRRHFGIACEAMPSRTDDRSIRERAEAQRLVIMTKDDDYARSLVRGRSRPQVLRVRCGNTSNPALRALLARRLPTALLGMRNGLPIVEIAH